MKLEFFDRFSKNTLISNFIKNRPAAAEFFDADEQTDRHDEATSVFFFAILETPLKIKTDMAD